MEKHHARNHILQIFSAIIVFHLTLRKNSVYLKSGFQRKIVNQSDITDFDTLVTLSPADPRWGSDDFIHNGDHPRVSALNIDGWYDFGAFETVKIFELLQDIPNQYLIMAPTAHCAMLDATEHTSRLRKNADGTRKLSCFHRTN